MYMAKTQINSAIMGMQHQLATMRMAGSIQSSNEVMIAMQKLVKVPEIMATMRELSKEMTKAGIITEMIEETMESLEPEELEEQAAVRILTIFFWTLFTCFIFRKKLIKFYGKLPKVNLVKLPKQFLITLVKRKRNSVNKPMLSSLNWKQQIIEYEFIEGLNFL